MKKLKVPMVCDTMIPIGENPDFAALFKEEEWGVERGCFEAFEKLGYEAAVVNVFDDINPLIHKIREFAPDVIFNMIESFRGVSRFERNFAGIFELFSIPYTGGNPTAMILCKNKALTKEILTHHRIRTPHFRVYLRGRKIRRPRELAFPLLVKPLREEASYGISRDSLVESDEALVDRVKFIHEKLEDDAIVEQFIEGRELYVSVLGNQRLEVFPIRELRFPDKENAPDFATYKVKWDSEYRKKWGVRYEFASLKDDIEKEVKQIGKRAYQALRLQGYGRIDLRLTPEGKIYVLEVNSNPNLSWDDDFALAARKAGLEYQELIKKIIQLGLEHKKVGD